MFNVSAQVSVPTRGTPVHDGAAHGGTILTSARVTGHKRPPAALSHDQDNTAQRSDYRVGYRRSDVQRTNNYLALDAVNNASDSQGCVATVPTKTITGR
jgi:hypothetical protein